MANYDLKISIRVSRDMVAELFATATARAVADGHGEAAEILCRSDGTPDIEACLIMLFDPGVSPDGCLINETSCSREEMDEDDDAEDEEI